MKRERLVIVGNGMATTRLVEELVARRYDGDITILGDEDHPAYNRILLSAVLEGSHPIDALTLRQPDWYAAQGIDMRTGARVLEIERDLRDVMLVDGTKIEFDKLVLATGAIPTLPPIRGLVNLDGSLHPKVHAFRSLRDCERLIEALDALPATGARAVVVGGGLLGLQVARALSVRGVETEVVEGTEHLLSQQVDRRGGTVLKRHLKKLGTEVYTGARAVRLTEDGLKLDNGFTLQTDLVVLTAGGRPSTALARRAGLTVRRGVVVGDQLQSVDDDAIFAIGDCAEHSGKVTGFVPPAWEQASLLAAHLAGEDVKYEGSRNVARLRATGLDVAVIGDPEHTEGDIVEVTNPIIGTHRKLVVDGNVIVAGTMIGDLSRIGLITQLFDRRTILADSEPGELLMAERPDGDSSTLLPDEAEVCACAGVSAGRIRACRTFEEAREKTRATTGCGGCSSVVQELIAARNVTV